MAITYNNIVKRFEDFANNHFFIERFTHGSPEDINTEKHDTFPLMHVVLNSQSQERDDGPFLKEYDIDIYILDKPSAKEDKYDRQKEIISDSLQVCDDILADISQGFSIFVKSELYGVDGYTATPLEEEFSHVLSGALANFSIRVPGGVSACNAPLTGVTPSTGSCPEATVNNNAGGASDYSQTVASGGTLSLPNISIIQQDDTVISSAMPSVVDVKVSNADITAVAYTGPHIRVDVDIPAPASGIAYQQHAYSTTSTYETYDQGWWFINRNSGLYHTRPSNPATFANLDGSSANPHSTLVDNNVHGNKNRFTAQDGTQTISAGDVIEDHLYYMEYLNEQPSATFANHLTDSEAETTDGGTTNHWRLACAIEYMSIICLHTAGWPTIFSEHSTVNYWLNDAYVFNTSQKQYAWALQNISRRTPGTTTYAGLYCRQGTW